jgi:hypothetical protein
MLVLGILLVAIAAAIVIAALVGGRGIDEPAGFDLGAVEINPNTFSVFLVGAVTVVVLVLGVALIQSGVRRARRRRHDKKELDRLSRKVEAQESPATTQTGTTETGAGDTRPGTSTSPGASTNAGTDTDVTERDRRSP